MIRKISTTLFVLSFALSAFSQQDLTLYYMNRIPQAIYANPAFIPDSRVNIGLPLISSDYFSISNSGFSYNNLFNVDNLINRLGKKNYFTTNFRIDILSVGIGVKNNYYSFNITEHAYTRFTYPKALFQLVWEGNGQDLLGTRANMNGLGFDLTHHREYAFGFSRKFSDKLTLGLRAKYLSGFQNIWTKTSQIGLTTDEETFDLTVDGKMQVYTSGINSFFDDNADLDIAKTMISAGNHGAALDLGGNYHYNEKISFSAAILDLGFISWNNDIRNFEKEAFNFTFSGFSLDDFVQGDTTGERSLEAFQDTLESAFKINETYNSYTNWLNARILLGGTYKLTEAFTAGALVHTEFIKGHIRPAFTVSMNTKVKRWLSASASYSILNRSYTNIGLGFSANAGPVQLYVVSDNALAFLAPSIAKNVHMRFGIALTFMRQKKPEVAAPSVY